MSLTQRRSSDNGHMSSFQIPMRQIDSAFLGFSSNRVARKTEFVMSSTAMAVINAFLLFCWLLFQGRILDGSLRSLSIMASLSAVIGLWSVIQFSSKGIWSAGSIYLLMFTLFHVGLTAAYAVGALEGNAVDDFTYRWTSQWLYRDSTYESVFLSAIGLHSSAIGILLARVRSSSTNSSREALERTSLSILLSVFGSALVVVSTVSWFYLIVSRGGLGALVGSYGQYQSLVADSTGGFGYIYFFLGVGLAFVAASDDKHMRKTALSVFAIFALFGLPLGLRGEVLFPSLTAAVIFAKKSGKMPSTRTTLFFVVAGLFFVSMIKNIREVGIQEAATTGAGGSVTAGLVELGGSIRSVSEVVLWRQQGDPLDNGQTYLAPFDRLSCHFFDHDSCVPAERDYRIMNILVIDRIGPIGFSPVAESYRNFGRLGVVFIMFTIGLLVSCMDRWSNHRATLALTGIVLIEALINVRNSFIAAPSHVVLGLAILAVVVFLSKSSPYLMGESDHPETFRGN